MHTGAIRGVEYSEVTQEELENAVEVYSLGGGHMLPVVSINNRLVGDGRPGPVYWELDSLLMQDLEENYIDDIPYGGSSRSSLVMRAFKRVVRIWSRLRFDKDFRVMGVGLFLCGYYFARSRSPRLEAIYM